MDYYQNKTSFNPYAHGRLGKEAEHLKQRFLMLNDSQLRVVAAIWAFRDMRFLTEVPRLFDEIGLAILRTAATSLTLAKYPSDDELKQGVFSVPQNLHDLASPVLSKRDLDWIVGISYMANVDISPEHLISVSRPDIAAGRDAPMAQRCEDPRQLFQSPLWRKLSVPIVYRVHQKGLLTRLRDEGPVYSYWADLYSQFTAGREIDWELLREVVLIPQQVWDEGADAIAQQIRILEGKRKTQVVAPLVRDVAAGVFRVESDREIPQNTLQFVTRRVVVALNSALEADNQNGIRENSYETLLIRNALKADNFDSSILATAFFDACLSLQVKIGDEYPNDPSITNLASALYAAVEEICELDEEAEKRCARLASLTQEALSPPLSPEELEKIANLVTKETDVEATRVIKRDAGILSKWRDAPKWIKARFTNYVATVIVWMEKATKIDKNLTWLWGKLKALVDWWG